MPTIKHLMTLSLCLLAAVAATALSASAASAAKPSLYECVKLPKTEQTGRYDNSSCTEEDAGHEGKWELEKGLTKASFKGEGHGVSLYALGIGGFTCSSSTDTGEVASANTITNLVIKLKGCEYNGLKYSSGTTPGEIVSEPLSGEFGYLAGKGTKTPDVGIALQAQSGEVIAAFHAQNIEFELAGGVIGEVTPVNQSSKETTWTFATRSLGDQEWEEFEGGLPDVLEEYVCTGCGNPKKEAPEQAALESTLTSRFTAYTLLKA